MRREWVSKLASWCWEKYPSALMGWLFIYLFIYPLRKVIQSINTMFGVGLLFTRQKISGIVFLYSSEKFASQEIWFCSQDKVSF